MPANKKYLSSPFQRFLKITAGFFAGYMLMLAFHNFMTLFCERKNIVMLSGFSGYIIWAILLLLAFLSKNGWYIWGIYLCLTLLLSIPFIF